MQIVEKDLSFYPANPELARTLTKEQVEFYNEHGYLFPFTAYSGNEVLETRHYFDQLVDEVVNTYGGNSYSINGYHGFCEGVADMIKNPIILDHVEDIIGPNIVAWGSHFFCKDPHDPKVVPWHQDASYWPFETSKTVTVWLAIDDVDEGNASMQFIPETHTKGHLEWEESKEPCFLSQSILGVEKMGSPVSTVLKAGQFSLHADMLAHGSVANDSPRRRCGLTIRYCPPSVKALETSWANNSFLCRGEDLTGNWAHRVHPVGNDLASHFDRKSKGKNKLK